MMLIAGSITLPSTLLTCGRIVKEADHVMQPDVVDTDNPSDAEREVVVDDP